MFITKQQIKKENVKKYYMLIDGVNDDIIARFTDLNDVKKIAREYDEDCDGEWDPVLLLKDRENGTIEYIEDWSY